MEQNPIGDWRLRATPIMSQLRWSGVKSFGHQNSRGGRNPPDLTKCWSGKNIDEHMIIWSDTGTDEKDRLVTSDRQEGDYNGTKNALTAEK